MNPSDSRRQHGKWANQSGIPVSWPRLAQMLWLALLLLVLYVLIVRVRVIREQAHALCTIPNCQFGQVTRDQARTLHRLGIPSDILGLYAMGLRALFEVMFMAVGGLIIWRQPWNPMAVFTAFTLLLFGGITVAGNPQVPPDIPQPLSFLVNALAQLGLASVLIFFYIFPGGRPVLRRLSGPLAFLIILLTLPLPSPSGTIGNLLSVLILFAPFGIVIYTQVYRYRTVSTPAQRQQTKWIIYGMTVGIVGFFLDLMFVNVLGARASLIVTTLLTTALYLFFLLIPLAIGFALLRYRLWDVDILINRTLVYGPLTAMLAALYLGSVIALQTLFRGITGQGSGLAVALSTLAIAALFQPLRRGLQTFIDRRFYRRKYDAVRTLAALSAHLRNDVSLDQVTVDVLAVVQETMQPTHVSLWIR